MAQTEFVCMTCEDTGLVWTPDPAWPQFRQADLLVPCICQLGETWTNTNGS